MSHVAYQRIGRTDDEPEDKGGLEPCLECDATGEIDGTTPDGHDYFGTCPFCEGKAYFLGEQPMTAQEYERFTEEMRYPS